MEYSTYASSFSEECDWTNTIVCFRTNNMIHLYNYNHTIFGEKTHIMIYCNFTPVNWRLCKHTWFWWKISTSHRNAAIFDAWNMNYFWYRRQPACNEPEEIHLLAVNMVLCVFDIKVIRLPAYIWVTCNIHQQLIFVSAAMIAHREAAYLGHD